MKTEALLLQHYQAYPQLNIQDIFKFLHQSAFGCEHLLASPETALDRICEEAREVGATDDARIEALDGAYSRVHLGCLAQGLSAQTLSKLFYLSAVHEKDGVQALTEKLTVAKNMIEKGSLPFSKEAFAAALCQWEADGFSALHHSDAFRKAYRPAYRVIANRFIPFLPLLTEIDKRLAKGNLVLAVEGGSASGKTTLGQLLEQLYPCTVLHMDDFFLRPEQRTKERFAEPGGNVDRERFLAEVLLPLHRREPIEFRPYDCATGSLGFSKRVMPKQLTVIEGAYSMHPDLADYYDLTVFLDIAPTLQKERIKKRNTPQMAQRFFTEWIPLEQVYFEKLSIKEKCDLLVKIEE